MARIWVRSLASRLRDHELVDKVKVWPAKLTVRYRNSVIERYWFLDDNPPDKNWVVINRTEAALTSPISINSMVESDLLDGQTNQYAYYSISGKQWSNGTAMDRAIAVVRFADTVCAAGYQSRMPQSILDDDAAALHRYDRSRLLMAGANGLVSQLASSAAGCQMVDFWVCNHPGRAVLSHYFDQWLAQRPPSRRCLLNAAANHRRVHYYTRRLLSRGRRATSHAVMKMIRFFGGPRIMPACSYAVLLAGLGVTSVFDPHPETGAKAAACAILGIPYYTAPNALFDDALRRGFAGQIGLDHRYVGDGGVPDCAVVDFNMAEFDYGSALGFADGSANVGGGVPAPRHLLVYVPGVAKGDAVAECAPDAIVDARMRPNEVGHFFYW